MRIGDADAEIVELSFMATIWKAEDWNCESGLRGKSVNLPLKPLTKSNISIEVMLFGFGVINFNLLVLFVLSTVIY